MTPNLARFFDSRAALFLRLADEKNDGKLGEEDSHTMNAQFSSFHTSMFSNGLIQFAAPLDS